MTEYDVAIIGGAFSGAAAGILLKRKSPHLRVVIVERSQAFDRKVGESTTEVSSCFLTRVLGLTNYLGHHQLPKQGLRMWFTRDGGDRFEDCAELGAMYNSRLPGFQVDRSTLDEQVLATAVSAGCELLRPARISSVELGGDQGQVLQVKAGDETRTLRAKWVIDASGRAAMLARQLGNLEPMTEHPTNSIWARFTGVKDWDGHELRTKYPAWAEATRTARGWATNHLCGLGWWVWIIPLKGGDVSIGLVYDTRLFTPPQGGSIGERILAHCMTHPVGREMLSEAKAVEGDQKAYSQLPYRVSRIAGNGWVCAGDAAGFLDPLYSPGLDFCSFTAQSAANLVASACAGEKVDLDCYNHRFAFCFRSWFEGIYRDKYYYLGDSELMAAAFLTDIASYHLGPVRQVYSDPSTMYGAFPFDGRPGRIAAGIIGFLNRRYVAIAKKRLAAGTYGARNANWRLLVGGFTMEPKVSGRLLFSGLWRWLKMEWNAAFLPVRKQGKPRVLPMPAAADANAAP